jgi:hypothetical protein
VTSCGFTYRHYGETLRQAREAGYAFAAFHEEPVDGRPFLLLRHDIDFSPELALPVARLEAALGIRSTVFVLPHAHYNPLGAAYPALREIVGLGHHLGIHYDLAFYAAHGLPPAETVAAEADALAARFGTPVAVAAQHNPGRTPRPEGLDLRPLLDAYGPAFTRETRYLSDSCQSWREGCFCGFLDPGRHPRLQVLTHPIWWSEDGRAADEALRAHTARRIAEARHDEREASRHYAGLPHLPNRKLFEDMDRE